MEEKKIVLWKKKYKKLVLWKKNKYKKNSFMDRNDVVMQVISTRELYHNSHRAQRTELL